MEKRGIKDVGRIAQMFRDADEDGNGKIEWTEFLEFTKIMKSGGKYKSKEKKKNIEKAEIKLTPEKRREILRMFHSMVSQFFHDSLLAIVLLCRIRTVTGLWTVRSLRIT